MDELVTALRLAAYEAHRNKRVAVRFLIGQKEWRQIKRHEAFAASEPDILTIWGVPTEVSDSAAGFGVVIR